MERNVQSIRKALIVGVLFGIAASVGALDATITTVSGKVEIRETGNAAWTVAEEGMTVPVGATISTGFNASAMVRVGESVVTVNQLTRMRIDELVTENGTDRSNINLRVGRIDADVRGTGGNRAEFRVRSPIATASVRGTKFSFDGANLMVSEGIVILANRFSEAVAVTGGEQSSAAGYVVPQQPVEKAESSATVTVLAGPVGERPVVPVVPVVRESATGNIEITWMIADSN